MPGAHYTAAALKQPEGSFGPIERFIDQYPKTGRKPLAKESLEYKYERGRELGGGALNLGVLVVTRKEGQRQGQKFIMKRIEVDNGGGRVLLREIEILQVLKHPNIVKFVDGYIPRAPTGVAELYLEYCDGSDLERLIKNFVANNKDCDENEYDFIPEAFIWHVTRSLASALAYLHYGVPHNDDPNAPSIPNPKWAKITHRDVKPGNMLLKSNFHTSSSSSSSSSRSSRKSLGYPGYLGYPTMVLADFGVSTQANEKRYNRDEDLEPMGTFGWQGPDVPYQTTKSEVWTVGAIMMAMCNQEPEGPVPPHHKWDDPEKRKGIRETRLEGFYYSTLLREAMYAVTKRIMAELKADYVELPGWAIKKR